LWQSERVHICPRLGLLLLLYLPLALWEEETAGVSGQGAHENIWTESKEVPGGWSGLHDEELLFDKYN
jgi:hypothetical protein